ncbi:RipA family octameric membrane protein [Streptomyces chartreusis]|uniref:RipA family octameric membrane protein n=1 Tax=Streptomyces chartreusis TaxID=1969 RepID=UPI0036468262
MTQSTASLCRVTAAALPDEVYMTSGSGQPSVSFEEYRLYYESTERVTERRLAMNRWNYSVLTASLLAIGVILGWASSHDTFLLAGIVGILILSVVACFMCFYWLKQIDDFKALNTAKFEVLNAMAPLVTFEGPNGTSSAQSFNCFDKEWRELARAQALQPSSSNTFVRGLRSSSAERFIPRAFGAIFALIFLSVVVFSALSWSDVVDHPSPFSKSGKIEKKSK